MMDSPFKPLTEALESVYGKASDAGFGSAVMHGDITPGSTIDAIALDNYKKFLGKKWTAESEARWMGPWKKVYARYPGEKRDILVELSSIADPAARNAIPLLTELVEDAASGKKALASAFNDEAVNILAAHTIGDGEVMSGIILTGIYKDTYACSVVTLMD